jgi:hypothetical protein
MAKAGLAVVITLLAIAGVPTAASATTCADYPNQAAAQRAHDTIDADHDRI